MTTRKSNAELFRQYISTRQTLICDPSLQLRTAIAKLLRELGARTENIFMATTYDAAVSGIQLHRPELLISDFHLGDQNGLKLLHHQKKQFFEPDSGLFILVTADANESSIAQAAEEEVDSYILKPFTIATFKSHLIEAVTQKFHPDNYHAALFAAKKALLELELTSALSEATRALALHSKPALAYYYLSQVFIAQHETARAETALHSGLQLVPQHYRCLTGLLDLFIKEARLTEALPYAKTLIETFPVSPQRLEAIIELAVHCREFSEIDSLFRLYQDMEYRTPELARCLSAALVVAGRQQLKDQHKARAMKSFDDATTVAGPSPSLLQEIIPPLLEEKDFVAAEAFLSLFPRHTRQEAIYRVMRFLILNKKGQNDLILKEGRKLIHNKVHDPRIFEIVIRRLIAGQHHRIADSMAYRAADLWPELRKHFLDLLP